MDDRFEEGLRTWARGSQNLDPQLLQVALQLEGSATPEEATAARAILERDQLLAEAAAIAAQPRVRSIRKWIAPIALCAAAIAAALFMRPPPLTPKGAADHLSVAVDRRGDRFELPAGAALAPGDRFGLFYSSAEPGHLLIVHQSSEGKTVLHDGEVEAAVQGALPEGGVITEVTGCERLVAVFSEKRISAGEITGDCHAAPSIRGARTVQTVPIER